MMMKKPLSQEALKLIACVAMLIDHIGAVFFPQHLWLRVIGRLSFPIYCFLLAEGVHYTKNPVKYGLRLLVSVFLSEIPFDLCFFGGVGVLHQSVMVTLLLGFLMALCIKKVPGWAKALTIIPFALAAEILHTDYGAAGVLMIAVFVFTRDMEFGLVLQTLGLAVINFWLAQTSIIQAFAVAAMLPITAYSGKKSTSSPILQWAFYLFYPVHLTVLWLISVL